MTTLRYILVLNPHQPWCSRPLIQDIQGHCCLVVEAKEEGQAKPFQHLALFSTGQSFRFGFPHGFPMVSIPPNQIDPENGPLLEEDSLTSPYFVGSMSWANRSAFLMLRRSIHRT